MSPQIRLALFYTLLFAGHGVGLPFISKWLALEGMSGTQIGMILSLPSLMRVITGPSLAIWADGFSFRRTAIAILGSLTAIGYALMVAGEGFWVWLGMWFVAATCQSASIPLMDVLTIRLSRRLNFEFSKIRSVGSLVFILANVAMGFILAHTHHNAILFWMMACSAAMAWVAGFILPQEPVRPEGDDSPRQSFRSRFSGMGELLKDRLFLAVITVTGLIQAAHAFQYTFSVLIWKELGISSDLAGVLWGFGVAAEVVFMVMLEPLRRRLGPINMVILSGLASVIRWSLMAFSPPLWALWPLQALHAFTFAACYLAGLELVERLVRPEQGTVAQTLSASLSGGVFIGGLTLVSGRLYDGVGAKGYLAMSVMVILALGILALIKAPLKKALALPA